LTGEANSSNSPPQACWLNNDGNPVIGILPKVAWQVYPVGLTRVHANLEATNQAQEISNIEQANKDVAITVVKTTRATEGLLDPFLPENDTCYDATYRAWIEELIVYSQRYSQNNVNANPSEPANGNHYQHGLMGFIGYDIAAGQLSPQREIRLAEQPSAYLGHYDIYLQPCADGWQLTIDPTAQDSLSSGYHQELIAKLTQLDQQLAIYDASITPPSPLLLTPTWDYEQYKTAFAKTQNYLYEGDSYQINLTQPWQGQLPPITQINSEAKPAKLLNYLPALHNNTGAPFAGYIGLADFELLSCSPELFLVFEKSADGANYIRTKPIKGTRPRGHDASSDQALRDELAASDKDRAENVMIVDLLRNDLGKYAQTGSVRVPKLFAIESFSNVHHLVSTITATIKEEVSPLSVLFGSLPAGSITGTPKKRAVEIIAELETAARGAYCGTLGYMNFDGSGQWNVLIRTLQAKQDGQVSLWAGGGITVGSDCAAEYQECVDKVGNLLGVLAKS
jgi:para-aminobenzoate synthetase component 1